MWKVFNKKTKRYIGIIETHYDYAFKYWIKRGFYLVYIPKGLIGFNPYG